MLKTRKIADYFVVKKIKSILKRFSVYYWNLYTSFYNSLNCEIIYDIKIALMGNGSMSNIGSKSACNVSHAIWYSVLGIINI